jgi:hypothetical protein
MHQIKYSTHTILIAACALMLAACSNSAAPSSSSNIAANNVGNEATSKILEASSAYASFDYEPAESVDEMANNTQVDLIVTGQIDGFNAGRARKAATSDLISFETIIMRVRVNAVLQGESNYVGKTIYIEQFVNAGTDLAAQTKKLAGSKVALYLAPGSGSEDKNWLDPNAGRPIGEAIWVSGPQGFVIEEPSGSFVVWPLLDEVLPGALSDTLPGGDVLAK